MTLWLYDSMTLPNAWPHRLTLCMAAADSIYGCNHSVYGCNWHCESKRKAICPLIPWTSCSLATNHVLQWRVAVMHDLQAFSRVISSSDPKCSGLLCNKMAKRTHTVCQYITVSEQEHLSVDWFWDAIFRTKCDLVEEHKLSESQSYFVIIEQSW